MTKAVNKPATKSVEPTKKESPKSHEDKLATAIKALGVDKVEVIKGADNGLVYAKMTKDSSNRILSVSVDDIAKTDEVAKSLVKQAGF